MFVFSLFALIQINYLGQLAFMNYKCKQFCLFILLVPLGLQHIGKCYLHGSCKNPLCTALMLALWAIVYFTYGVTQTFFLCVAAFKIFLDISFICLFIDESADKDAAIRRQTSHTSQTQNTITGINLTV